jgi:hypothetical protein
VKHAGLNMAISTKSNRRKITAQTGTCHSNQRAEKQHNTFYTLTFFYSGLQSSGMAFSMMLSVPVVAALSLFPMSFGIAAAVAPTFFRTCVWFQYDV